jgi:transcriptional regulator with XRE-family HTH domain
LTTARYAAPVNGVNLKFLQGVALSTTRAEQFEPVTSGKRQKFHREIGRELAKLRKLKNLSQGQVALRGRGKITEGTLKAIETGRVKNPDPDHLRALAAIYGVPFAVVADPFIRANYGSDLARHDRDRKSGSSSHVGDPIDDATAARIQRLEEDNATLRSALDQTEDVARQLGVLATHLSEGREAALRKTGSSSVDRKTGR